MQSLRLAFLLLLSFSHAQDAGMCPFQIVNPFCDAPISSSWCVPASTCSSMDLSGPVGCSNWFCSLRTNCGCFAGVDTSCNSTDVCNKPGCGYLVTMFNEMNCNWTQFVGGNDVGVMLNECLAGCNDAALTRLSWAVLGGVIAVGALTT